MRPTACLAASLVVLSVPAAARGDIAVDGRSALVVGDSLAVGTKPYLPALLPGWRLEQRAAAGAQTREGVRRVLALTGRLPAHVVLSLGTNDDPRNVGAFRRSVQAVLAAAGPDRCVVWPNIVRPAARGVSYDAFNRALAAEARLHAPLRIVDWASMTRAHADWLRRDGVHATAAGYRARAAAIARALARCAA